MNLRSKTVHHEIFGEPEELKTICLPSNRDIGKAYLHEKKFKTESISAVCSRLSEKVKVVWDKASIPTISLKGIAKQLQTVITRVQEAKRSKWSVSINAEVELSIDNLFDICSCKCENFKSCICPLNEKVLMLFENTIFK